MVLLLAWETWCPTWGFLPVTWQTRAMECSGAKGTDYRATGAPLSSDTLKQAALGKRHGARPGDDEMVEHLNVDQSECAFQGAGEDLVGMARLGDAGGVVMSENHRRGVMLERALHDLARVNARLGQRAVEQLLAGDDAMLRVQKKHHEYLLFAPAECKAQVVAHRPRRRQRIPRGDFLLERAARQFQGRPELRELGAPHTRGFREVRGSGIQQPADRAEAPEQLACEVDRALSLDAGTKQNRKQLGVGERGGAEREQPFARTLLQGPVGNRHEIRLKSPFCRLTPQAESR